MAVSSHGIQDHLGAKSANWLASWLAVLSTSFSIPGVQTKQSPATRLRFFLKDGSCNCWLGGTMMGVSKMLSQVRIIFRGFFLIFKIKTKSDGTSFWRMFLPGSGWVRYITSEFPET